MERNTDTTTTNNNNNNTSDATNNLALTADIRAWAEASPRTRIAVVILSEQGEDDGENATWHSSTFLEGPGGVTSKLLGALIRHDSAIGRAIRGAVLESLLGDLEDTAEQEDNEDD